MAYEKITGFRYRCDECGETHEDHGAEGTYADQTPPAWLTIRWKQGESVRRGDKLLCTECARPIMNALAGLSR